jgi:hypothetical protein
MDRMIRIVVITALAGATLWFGLSYGPAPGVRADIYMDLVSSYRSVPDLTDSRVVQRTGVTLLNGNKIYYRVSTSEKNMHQVLDEYQEAFTPKHFKLFARDRLPNLLEAAKVAPELPFFEFLMNQKRIVREESSQWGLVSFLDMGPEANQDWHAVFKRKLTSFAHTGRLGDLGIAKTVLAAPSPTGGPTTVIAYWTDPEFNVRDLQDQGEGDRPGKDVENFPRIQPTRRVLTFEQVDERLPFLMVMYETSLSSEQALSAYQSECVRMGWSARRQERAEGADGEILYLDRGSREVQLFARREGQKTLVLVNQRNRN